MDETLRTIEDILLLYDVEPKTKDIYVEGISDKLIIERFIDKNKLDDVKVIEVQEINFKGLYNEYPDIKANNKAKLIALNDKLEREFGRNLEGISIIVDKDFDDFLKRLLDGFYLIYSDYNSIELYLYNSHVLDIFYKNILHSFPLNGQQTLERLTPVLTDKFFVRLTLDKDGSIPEGKFTPFNKSIKIDKRTRNINFVPTVHIQKVLNNIKKTSQLDDFNSHFDKLKSSEVSELRNVIRGHDFINLFFDYINIIKNNIGLTLETIERILFQCVDYSELKKEPLFSHLMQKYSPL